MTTPGGTNVGTAYGKVRIDYESTGVAKAVKDVEALQQTMVDAGKAAQSSAKNIQKSQGQILQSATAAAKALEKGLTVSAPVTISPKKVELDTGAITKALNNFKPTQKALKLGIAVQISPTKVEIDQGAITRSLDALGRNGTTQKIKISAPVEVSASDVSVDTAAIEKVAQQTGLSQITLRAPIQIDPSNVSMSQGALSGVASKLKASPAASSAASDAGLAAGAVGGLTSKLGGLARLAGPLAIVAGVGTTLTAGFSRLQSIDQANIKLKALGYNAAQVKEVSEAALKTVKGTAFGLDEAFSAATTALASGIKPGQQLNDYLSALASTAALANTSMTDLGDSFSQASVQGKLTGDILQLLYARNVPVLQLIGKEYDVTQAKAQEMVSNSEVSFDRFIHAMNQNKDAAKIMGSTVSGSFDNLMASVKRIGAGLLAPLFATDKDGVSNLAKAIQWLTDQTVKFENFLSSHKNDIIDFWVFIGKAALGSLSLITDGIGWVIEGIGKLIEGIGHVPSAFAGIADFFGAHGVADDLRGASDNMTKWGNSTFSAGQKVFGFNSVIEKGMAGLDNLGNSLKNGTGAIDGAGNAAGDAGPPMETLAEALEKLGIKADSVDKQIFGTTKDFKDLIKQLEKKNAPQGLIDALTKLRSEFDNGGRAASEYADAIENIKDQTADASSKADALLSALQKMGLLPGGDALESYNKQFEEMTSYSANLVDPLGKVGDALVDMNGEINTSEKNGQTLFDTIKAAQKELYALASSGEVSPGEAFDRTAQGLTHVLEQFGIQGQAAQDVINKYLTPGGAGKAAFEANFIGDPKKALEAAFTNDPAKLDSLIDLLTTKDDIINELTGGPGATIKIPAEIALQSTIGNKPGGTFGDIAAAVANGQNPPPAAAPYVPPPPSQAGTRGSVYAPGVVRPNSPFGFDSGFGFDTQGATVAGPQNGVVDRNRLAQVLGQNADLANTLNPVIAQADSSGTSLADAFAQGIANGTPEVKDALLKLAQLAPDILGSSPAKYGPLSGKGWTFFRGQTFTNAYAEGIESASATAQKATGNMAQAATMPFGQQIEQMIGDLQQLSDFGKLALNFGKQLGDIAFGAAKIANNLTGGRLFPKTYTKDTTKLPSGSALDPWNPNRLTPAGQPVAVGGVPSIPSQIQGRPGVLHDTEGVQSQTAARTTAAIISQLFPAITDIGGGRASGTAKNTHDVGRAIDVMIPDYGTPQGKALGDQINDFVRTYHDTLGVDYTIWQNTWKDFSGNMSTITGHMNHIDIQFKKDFIPSLDGLSGTLANAANAASPGAGPAGKATANPITGQFKDIGNGFYQSRTPKSPGVFTVARNIDGKFYDVSDLAVGPDGGPVLTPEGLPQARVQPTAPGPQQKPAAPSGGGLNDQQSIANYIISKAMSLGYSREQANEFATQAFGESGLSPTAYNKAGWSGIFQFDAATFAGAGGGNVMDAKNNIDNYFRLAQQRGLTPENFTSGTQLGTQVSIGGPYHPQNAAKGHLSAAQAGVAPFLAGFQPGADTGQSGSVLGVLNNIADNTSTLPSIPQGLQEFKDVLSGMPKSQEEAVSRLQNIDALIADQNKINTPEAKAKSDALSQYRSGVISQFGLKEGPSQLDQAEGIFQGVSGIASDIFETFDAGLKYVGALKHAGDVLVRGIANTDDIMKLIDDFQTGLDFAAKILNTAGSITSFAGSFTGGSDFGATSAAGGIIQMVGQVISAINTGIDLAQEAYKITTKYVGRFLTSWLGFPGATDMKFLLDTVTGQLHAYTSENPQMKHDFNTLSRSLNPGKYANSERPAPTNQFVIYQGPGQDPRDTMDDAMFTVRSSGVGAFGYDA